MVGSVFSMHVLVLVHKYNSGIGLVCACDNFRVTMTDSCCKGWVEGGGCGVGEHERLSCPVTWRPGALFIFLTSASSVEFELILGLMLLVGSFLPWVRACLQILYSVLARSTYFVTRYCRYAPTYGGTRNMSVHARSPPCSPKTRRRTSKLSWSAAYKQK